MGYLHRYKQRDFDFAQLLVTRRKKVGLTQEEVALRLGVAEKSIRNWEAGSNYPTELHLRKLIKLYLDKNVFGYGQERDEARLLWNQLHERVTQRIGIFDEQWFVALFQEWRARSASQAQQSSYLPHGNWSEVPDVSASHGRTEELAELERWLLIDQCRLVALLGMGGIGKTALAVTFVQQVAPHFSCMLWRSLQNAPPLADCRREIDASRQSCYTAEYE